MASKHIEEMRSRIRRRIAVKSVVLGFWAVCMIAAMVQGGIDLAGGTFLSMTVAIVIIWAVTTFRDVRRLRDDAYLQQAAVAENDERNVQIMLKATRLAAVVVGCASPVAICVFSYLGMQQAANAIAGAICLFLVVYLCSWAYVSSTC